MNHVEQTYKAIQADKKLPGEVRKAGPFDSLVLVAKARNVKHALPILNAFHRLLTADNLEQNQARDIIDACEALAQTNQEIQLKVLQTLPFFLSTSTALPTGSNLVRYLGIPVGLLDAHGIVGSIASATLQQLLVSLFDNTPQSRESDVSRVFEDLCASFTRNDAGFVSFQALKQPLVLELLESILVANSKLFTAHPSLLDANLLPMITAVVTEDSSPHPILIRALRLCRLLIPTKHALLTKVMQYLPKAHLTRQVLILETIEACMQDVPASEFPQIISSLAFFEDSIPGLGTYSICAAPADADEQFTADGLMYTATTPSVSQSEGYGEWCRPSRQLTSQIHAAECPKFQPGYKPLLIFTILSTVSKSPHAIWRDTLVLHSAILSSCISQQLESKVLSDIAGVIVSLDDVEDKKPRDWYLRRLGRIAVSSSLKSLDSAHPLASSSGPGELVHRSFACLHTYLKTITTIRNSFNMRGWAQVLDILCTTDSLLSRKTRATTRQTGGLMGTVLSDERSSPLNAQAAAEMSRLTSSIENFFRTSDVVEQESFTSLIEAICSMHTGVPGSPLTATPSISRFNSPTSHVRQGSLSSVISFGASAHFTPTNNIFAVEKLRQLVPCNITRFTRTDEDSGWHTLLRYLSDEIRADNVGAAEILGEMITKATQIGLHAEAQQQRFVTALEALYGEGQIQLIQLATLASMLEVLGHELLCGWDLVLQILFSSITQGPGSTAEVVRLGFSCLHLICTDLLQSIPADQTALLIETTVGFCSQKEALNISLSAVGHFWTILGALPKHDFAIIHRKYPDDPSKSLQKDENIWLLLMENLNHICADERPEVRNSAIQASFRTLSTTETIGPNIWLSSVHLLLQHMHGLPFKLQPDSLGYIETVNAVSSGTGKVILSLIDASQHPTHFLEVCTICLDYLRDVSMLTRVECASFSLNLMLQIVTSFCGSEERIDPQLEAVLWRNITLTGQGILGNETSEMSQEGIATYLSILYQMVSSDASLADGVHVVELIDLIHDALLFCRSQLYYVDIDYLSLTQKPALALITLILEQCSNSRQLVLGKLAATLELAALIETQKHRYVFVSRKSSTWHGRPTFISFTLDLLGLVSKFYRIEDDSDLEAMAKLIRTLNKFVQARLSQASLSNKLVVYHVWHFAVNQVLEFVDLVEDRLATSQADQIWNEILPFSEYLFQSHNNQSEEFVLASLNHLRGRLVPALGNQKQAHVQRYVEALYRGSLFFHQAELIEATTVPSTYYPDQIIREWCFLELCKMSILTASVAPEKQAVEICAVAALPWTIKRAQNILHRYNNNAQLRANAPLPHIEYAELLLLLDHLSDDSIVHANQRALLKSVYVLVVEALLVNQKDTKVLQMLKNTLMQVGNMLA